MLHLEYKKQDYKGSRIAIEPGSEGQIPRLRHYLRLYYMIENPAAVFARDFKSGAYDGVPEEKVAAEAEVVNLLSDLWDGESSENVLMLLSRCLQTIANLKLGGNALKPLEDSEEDPFADMDEEELEKFSDVPENEDVPKEWVSQSKNPKADT